MGAAAGQKKKIYIEVIRLMAIIMVLYGHTSVNGLMYFNLGKMNRSSQIAIWIYPVIAGSVKLFFMISGALLLKKEVFKILHCYCGGSADLLCARGSGYIGCRLF